MPETRRTLYLIDGSGYIFRAFFALPQMNTSHGLPTNAVYGFVRMLFKLLKDSRPSHVAVVFDSPRQDFSRRSVRVLQGQSARDAERSEPADSLYLSGGRQLQAECAS